MTQRERLMATLRGEPVDRPPVSFYKIDGSQDTQSFNPIEPSPQGDVELGFVREKVGNQMVLFGNLEASDIENLPTPQFEKKIVTAIREGTAGQGRGFVRMPSACPYGRVLAPLALANYRKMVEVVA